MFKENILGVLAAILLGCAIGIGLYTFIYARGASYLSNNPEACANCHVMKQELDGWVKSSHRSVATCNDCHTPANFIGKYATKASNGFWHSFYFTTGRFKEPIEITDRNRRITEENCRRCHADTVAAMDGPHSGEEPLSCLRCHGSVGHP